MTAALPMLAPSIIHHICSWKMPSDQAGEPWQFPDWEAVADVEVDAADHGPQRGSANMMNSGCEL